MRCVCDGGMVWMCGLSGHQRAHVAFFISLFLFLICFWTTIGATTTRTVIKICRTQTIGINDYAGLTRLLVLSAWINEWRVTLWRLDEIEEINLWKGKIETFGLGHFANSFHSFQWWSGITATESTAYLLRRSCQKPFIILFVCVLREYCAFFECSKKQQTPPNANFHSVNQTSVKTGTQTHSRTDSQFPLNGWYALANVVHRHITPAPIEVVHSLWVQWDQQRALTSCDVRSISAYHQQAC